MEIAGLKSLEALLVLLLWVEVLHRFRSESLAACWGPAFQQFLIAAFPDTGIIVTQGPHIPGG